MGYHLIDIPRGEYGELSKVAEELIELKDALQQNANIMVLCELSDLHGAIIGVMKKHKFGNATLFSLRLPFGFEPNQTRTLVHLVDIIDHNVAAVMKLQKRIEEDGPVGHIQAMADCLGNVAVVLLSVLHNYPGFSLGDLAVMANLTSRAFTSGARK